MTDKEIYRILRVSNEERSRFISSLEGELLDRAYDINEMMNDAFDEGRLEELDKEYGFVEDEPAPAPAPVENHEAILPVDNDVVARMNDVETPVVDDGVEEESNNDDVVFEIEEPVISDEAMSKLLESARLIDDLDINEIVKPNLEDTNGE